MTKQCYYCKSQADLVYKITIFSLKFANIHLFIQLKSGVLQSLVYHPVLCVLFHLGQWYVIVIIIIIIIIISKTMFMVLSSWQSHCESLPGSFDECRTAPSGRRPKTKPDDLGCESACTGCRVLSLSNCKYSLNRLSQTRIDRVGRYRIR